MKNTNDTAKLLIGEPLEFSSRVYIHTPTVRDVLEDLDEYNRHVTALTVMTRQIFVEAREVDQIEYKYPTVWDLMCNPQLNVMLGGITGIEGKRLSDLIIDALAYWTKLENPPKEVIDSYTEEERNSKTMGFAFLENGGRIINYDTEWIIDKKEFERFVKLVKFITNYQQPENLAPKIRNDLEHEKWLDMYRNEQRYNKGKQRGMVDKIIVAQVMTPSFIPIEEIMNMTIFNFYQLFKVVDEQSAYKASMDIAVSPKFSPSKNGKVKFPEDWKNKYKVINSNI